MKATLEAKELKPGSGRGNLTACWRMPVER